MAKTARPNSAYAALIKSAMPGWSLGETKSEAATDVARPAADFQGKDMVDVVQKYSLVSADSAGEHTGEDAALVQVKPKGHEDAPVGSKTIVVSNGRIVGVQG